MEQEEVQFQEYGHLGVAQLSRPKALNALNNNMVRLLSQQYTRWNTNENIHCILIQGSPKAFCAGGDVKQSVLEIRKGNQLVAKQFFKDEYRLNHQLSALEKPHVAIIDGVTMGGGAGISIHGLFRIATERTVFAMPETGIGLFPDVGATYFLSRLPGQLGIFLGVTGTRLKGYQVLEAGLATHFVSSSRLDALRQDLRALDGNVAASTQIEHVLSSHQEASRNDATPSGLLDVLPEINTVFGHDSMEGIQAALGSCATSWAKPALELLHRGSKLSQKITLRAIQLGRSVGLADCLRLEYRLVSNIIDSPQEFDEGIRALLIDKDNKPRWQPPVLEKVTKGFIDKYFAPLPEQEELKFQEPQEVSSRL